MIQSRAVVNQLVAIACVVSLWGCAGRQEAGSASPVSALPPVSAPMCDECPALNETITPRWGVEIMGLRTTAGGLMLDFRYRVVDVDKAQPLFDRRVSPVITSPDDPDLELGVPRPGKVGPLRQSPKYVKEGRIYFMMFANVARRLNSGDLVRLAIGDFEVSGLRIM